MSKVIILGAGSSKECGLPLGEEIWEFIEDYDNEPWYRYLSSIFPRFSDNFLQGHKNKYPKFELALSLIDCANKSSLVNSYKKVFILKYGGLLLPLYKDEDPFVENLRYNMEDWYYPFFKKSLEKDKDTVFVSISYDGLIDEVLSKLDIENRTGSFTYGFKIYDLEGRETRSDSHGMLLLKPHGSINLMECPTCGKVFDYFCDPTEVDPPEGNKECCYCKKKLDTLMLVQGCHDFNKENPYYRSINEKLSNIISGADNISIIGYSLPDYDTDILQAFLKGAMNNKNRESMNIDIIGYHDPKAYGEEGKRQEQEIKSKYGAIFNQSVRYHGEGFKEYARACLACKET
ncbi:MAG: hypothetical protein PHC68_15985 [Syntrophorhabdaceae bacterium]|jgi:hypothetical protein|nr:hypothetical protein [Syntrophorhabdaceae bacterium]